MALIQCDTDAFKPLSTERWSFPAMHSHSGWNMGVQLWTRTETSINWVVTSKFPLTEKIWQSPSNIKVMLLLHMTGMTSFSYMPCLLGQKLQHSILRNSGPTLLACNSPQETCTFARTACFVTRKCLCANCNIAAEMGLGDIWPSALFICMSPCDFDLFQKLKEPLWGQRFPMTDATITAIKWSHAQYLWKQALPIEHDACWKYEV